METLGSKSVAQNRNFSFEKNLKGIFNYLCKEKYLYLMLLPGIIVLIVFSYVPMYGLSIAFKNYNISKGIWGSDWVGFKYFISFFNNPDCWKIIRNTLLLSIYGIIFAFPMSIIFALLLNEMGGKYYKKVIQTVSYLPRFLSTVVVVGMGVNFLSPSSGIVNIILNKCFGMEPIFFMSLPEWFRSIFTGISIWQGTGWNAIIYIAALSGIDPQLYEAAIIDGAGRFKQMIYVTLPCLMPTIVIMLLLNLGQILNIGFESIILLYNPMIYETADVIGTFVYRRGIINSDYSFSTAVGLFQSIIGFITIMVSNKLSQKFTDTGLW